MLIPTTPLSSPAAWEPHVLAEKNWIYTLDAEEREEVIGAARALRERGEPLSAITIESHPLPRLGRILRDIRATLRDGRGFVLMRGLPVADLTLDEVSRIYWLLGRHLGDPISQNAAGELLCSVRDTGADPKGPTTRLYTTRAEQDFHTDGADIIGLVCLEPARSGGLSRIVSSVRVFNEMLSRRPDLAPLLFQDWYWHLHGQEPKGFPPFARFPICRFDGKALSTFFIGWYIRRAQLLPDVPPLSPVQEELLALYESVANDPKLYLDMDFQRGDIQWLKNSVILHKRTEYEDWDEPERKRHLIRLWLAARDFPDGNEVLRGGIYKQQ